MSDLEYDNFDWNNYVSHYEDLKNDNINTREKAWKHWISHGKKEGRQYFDLSEIKKIVSNEIKELEKSVVKLITPVDENFNWKKYIGYYQDLKNDNVDTKEKAWNHWVKYGEKEGRNYFELNEDTSVSNMNKVEENAIVVTAIDDKFNWKKYVSYYKDLKEDSVDSKEKAWSHWIRYGEKEGRIYFDNTEYKNFDWNAYVEFYDDLRNIVKKKEKAWEHWSLYGKLEKRIYFDLKNISDPPKGFDWEDYVHNYEDLKNITNKEIALKHWLNTGIKENRTFSYKNTTKTKKYNFENSFFINLACHYLSLKYNTVFEYKHYDLFKKFGFDLFVGKNTYKNNFMLTNENFFTLINEANNDIDIKKENITLSDDLHCVTKDFCLFVKNLYYNNNDNKNQIISSNLFKERYVSNNDLYIYISTNSFDEKYSKHITEYYIESIKKVGYEKVYISSNDIKHEICQKLINLYKMTVDDKEICEKIMFANTCKYLILSSDITSLLIGLFNFFSKNIYYPIVIDSKYNEIFDSFYWKGTDVAKINILPKLTPPTLKNQAPSPTEEWYDSPFIKPKPEKNESSKTKPILKVRFQEETPNEETLQIKFEKFH